MIAVFSDFHKIGGFALLPGLLGQPHAALRAGGAELIATLAQNNEYCQNALHEDKVLPLLLQRVDDEEENELVRTKALYAVSCKALYTY